MPINYKRYPYNFRTTLHQQVSNRSGESCEKCGLKNGTIVISHVVKKWNGKRWVYRRDWSPLGSLGTFVNPKEVKVVLTKAHINHDSNNPHITASDLLHLCQLCHLRYDSYMKARRKACGKWCLWPNCNISTCLEYLPR